LNKSLCNVLAEFDNRFLFPRTRLRKLPSWTMWMRPKT